MTTLELAALLAVLRRLRIDVEREADPLPNGSMCRRCGNEYWSRSLEGSDGHVWGQHEPDCVTKLHLAEISDAIALVEREYHAAGAR